MDQHDHTGGAIVVLFTIANLVIAAGYAAVPIMVLPYLPLTKRVIIFGAGFFAGCAGTHIWMAFGMPHSASWFWVIEHVLQAFFTWGFLISFRRMLCAAQSRRRTRSLGEPGEDSAR